MSTSIPFIDQVTQAGHFPSRDLATETVAVIFRSLREMMTQDTIERVRAELKHKTALAAEEVAIPSQDQAIEKDLAELWQDPDPVAGTIMTHEAPHHLSSNQFLERIQQQIELPPSITPEGAVKTVFSLTKPELSEARVQEVSTYLPDKIQQMWMDA